MTSTYTEILKLIETVDPEDTAKLDEIDCRIWCYLRGYKFSRMFDGESYPWEKPNFYVLAGDDDSEVEIDRHCCGDYGMTAESYTRSRDALKAIRPEGYILIGHFPSDPEQFRCEFLCDYQSPTIFAYGATEELAELHAIIQAIESDRSQAGAA